MCVSHFTAAKMLIQTICLLAIFFKAAQPHRTILRSCNCIRIQDCPTFTQPWLHDDTWGLEMSFPICGHSHPDSLVCCPSPSKTFTDGNIHTGALAKRGSRSDIWVWPNDRERQHGQPSVQLRAAGSGNGFGKDTATEVSKPVYLETDFFDFKDPKTQRNFPHSFYEEIGNAELNFNDQPDSAQFHSQPFGHANFPHSHSHSDDSSEELLGHDDATFTPFPHSGLHVHRPVIYPDDARLHRPVIFPNFNADKSSAKRKPIEVEPIAEKLQCGSPNRMANVNSEQHYPWLARIAYLNMSSNTISYRCSGSVISQFHILTAAHCVMNLVNELQLSHLRIGSTRLYHILNVLVHPKYDQPKYANDIAIVKINRAPNGEIYFTPICLPPNFSLTDMNKFIGSTGIALGWSTNGVSDAASPSVKFLFLPVVNTTECAITYAKYSENFDSPIVITPSQLCAQGRPMNDVCQGDSGGPFMDDGTNGLISTNGIYTLLGIVAFGPTRCGVTNIPGVYTRVSSYAEWILANIG